jgi:hypothetical protein
VALPDGARTGAIVEIQPVHELYWPERFSVQVEYASAMLNSRPDKGAVELMRLRNAERSRCTYCQNVRFTSDEDQVVEERLIDALDDYGSDGSFSDLERQTIGLADKWADGAWPLDFEELAPLERADVAELLLDLFLYRFGALVRACLGIDPAQLGADLDHIGTIEKRTDSLGWGTPAALA